MHFWRLNHPDYESEYKLYYINGSLVHPYGLPGVRCGVCHQTWGGSRILPFECPVSLRRHRHLNERWPVSLEEHRALQLEVQSELRKVGVVASRLYPGDDFQPCYLDIPSIPRADFIWACLGSVVISQRIRTLLESLRVEHVSYYPVTLREVGTWGTSRIPPRPLSGEPEDVINEVVPPLSRTDSIGPYFELVVQTESGRAPGAEPDSICGGCGRETYPDKADRLVMRESMWKGADIFFLASTLWIVVTDRVRGSLLELGATNVQFSPFTAA